MTIWRSIPIILFLVFSTLGFSRPVVVLLTDFGLANEAVGQCHGAILAVDSEIEVVDLCHNVNSYDIQLGALMLHGTTTFPKGTVFVTVVDPGVGTKRKPIAVQTKSGYFYVGPDNGVFTSVMKDQGVEEAVEIDPRRVNPNWATGTFDGRDLFSPAGARIASAKGGLEAIGNKISADTLVTIPIATARIDASRHEAEGVFLRVDEPYGNLWTNISRDDLTSAGIGLGNLISLKIGRKTIEAPFVETFGNVSKGKPLAYICSNGSLAFAVNLGNFVKKYQLEPGSKLLVGQARAGN